MNSSALPWEKESRELAQDLYGYFAARTPAWLLKKMGWYAWFGGCVPLTDNPATIASNAFCYLYLEDQYTGNRLQGLMAVVTFLKDKMGASPNEKQLIRLKAILDARPVDPNLVRDWFEVVY